MPRFTVTLSVVDPRDKQGLFFKQDGQRFSTERTVKVCTDAKYDIQVTVKPPVAPLR